MRRLIIIAVALLTVFVFSSCKKDGVYKPGRKINRIYYSYSSDYSQTQKYLKQRWNWDGKLLKSINYYSSSGSLDYTLEFTYDGKRLTRVDDYSDGESVRFTYDGRKLSKMGYYEREVLCEEIDFTYDGGKISRIDWQEIGKKSSKGKSMLTDILPIVIPSQGESISRSLELAKNESKSLEYGTIKFTWDGGNITEVENEENGWVSHSTYTYDDCKNPYKGFVLGLGDEGEVIFGSKNNVTREIHTSSSGSVSEYNYSYSYDGKWPERQTCSYTYSSGGYYSSTYYYEYED